MDAGRPGGAQRFLQPAHILGLWQTPHIPCQLLLDAMIPEMDAVPLSKLRLNPER